MKCPHWQRLLACISLLVPVFAAAQTASQAGSSGKAPDGETIILSPFVVDSSADEGYSSRFSTSGSRLKTDLKDIAASVTVLTDDFMNDLGANDVASALAFVAGAENDSTYHQESVAGLGSSNGYVGGDFGDNNNRSGEVRVRGLGRATTTINYVEVLGSTDRYNTDRTEFLRGANSILFGLAEPAGLVNSSTKIANTRRDATKVEVKVDNFGSNRFVLDVNQALIKDKLAVRAVGLYNDQRYQVDSAFLRDKRLFLTGTYQPFKGTTLRAYYEAQKNYGRRPNNRTVQDNVSEWLQAYNKYAPQMTQAQIDAAFFWDPTVPSTSTNGIAPASVFTLSNGSTVDLGLIRRPLDTRPNGTTLLYNGNGQWNDPFDNLVTLMASRTVTGGASTPASQRSQFARSGSARENNPAFVADPQVTDQGIFPYESVEIAALPGAYRTERDRKIYFTLDQRITDDLYLSASFQRETWNEEQYFPTITQTNQISVDINKHLPDGRVNPNFLRPFIYGRNLGENSNVTLNNFLVQANYDFDFARKTRRFGWLGSHRLTGLYTSAKNDRLRYQFHYQIDNDVPVALTAAGNNAGANTRWAMQQWYVGDPVQLGDTALRFTGFPTTTTAHWDRSYDYLFYNNTVTPNAWQKASEKVHYGRQLVGGGRSYTIQKNDGFGLSLQSFFWKKKIVTLFGWRHDNVDSFQGVPMDAALFPFPVTPGVSRDEYEQEGSTYQNSANTTTQSIVYKITNKLRAFANRSENFAATTPRQDNLYRPIAPQSGKTDEAGFGLTLIDGKLDLKASYYKSSQIGATSATAVAGLRIPPVEGFIYDALEAAGRLGEWSTISPFGGTTTDRYERPNNGASTEDRVSKGYSLEMTFQPNRHWDFVGSVSKLNNVSTNVGHEVGEFLAVRAPFYKKYFDEGLRKDGTTTNTASQLLSEAFAETVATNYIGEILKEGISNRGVSEYTALLVGRYKFVEGRLKGLTIGTNLRWESGKVIGYAQKDAVFNLGGLTNYPGKVSDTSKEYTGDPVLSGGMVISYSRKIYHGRVNWKIQLNAQNLFSETGLRVFAANADGSPVWAVSPPRSYELTNTFAF